MSEVHSKVVQERETGHDPFRRDRLMYIDDEIFQSIYSLHLRGARNLYSGDAMIT